MLCANVWREGSSTMDSQQKTLMFFLRHYHKYKKSNRNKCEEGEMCLGETVNTLSDECSYFPLCCAVLLVVCQNILAPL